MKNPIVVDDKKTTNPKVGGSNPSWCASKIKGLGYLA